MRAAIITCAHPTGTWTITGNGAVLDADQEFVFFGNMFDNATTVKVHVSLYGQKKYGSSAGLAFVVDPTLTKMSLYISHWPWHSPNNTLSLVIPVDPPFVAVARYDDSPQAGTTTYLLQGQHDGRAQTTVRVLHAAEIDSGIAQVRSVVDVDASTLTLVLPFFGANLTYDPGTLPDLHGNERCLIDPHTAQTLGWCLQATMILATTIHSS